MTISLKTRLKLAWMVFNLKKFNICIEGWHNAGDLNPWKCECDGTWDSKNNICKSGKSPKYCYSTTLATFDISYDHDHFHCCSECACHIDTNDTEWMKEANLIG